MSSIASAMAFGPGGFFAVDAGEDPDRGPRCGEHIAMIGSGAAVPAGCEPMIVSSDQPSVTSDR